IVTNSNANHAYDGGTLVVILKSYLDTYFGLGLSCDLASTDPSYDPRCNDDISAHDADVFANGRNGPVMIGNYAGPVALNDDGTARFPAPRDINMPHAVSIPPATLQLSCWPGSGTTPDCRKGLTDLGKVGVLGPFPIVAADVTLPTEAPRRAFFVSGI